MVTVVICTPSARRAPLVKEAAHPRPARGTVARAGSRLTSASVDGLFGTVALLLGWVSLASSCFSSTQLVDNVPCGPALCFDLGT
eukprot:scaffold44425_cov80-Phaeocystis_antarctica.AAC.1